jgi:hypothetical protein
MNLRWLVAIAAFALASPAARAELIVSTGVDNSGTDNVIFNACNAPIGGAALTVAGCLNTDHTQVVSFTAEESITASGGQARVDATDTTGFSQLSISVSGSTFNKLVLNIDSRLDGSVTFSDGVTTSSSFPLDQNGQNFFTITGGPFTFIQITTALGVTLTDLVVDAEQFRIGLAAATIPEPTTLLLLGLGLAVLGAARLRRC